MKTLTVTATPTGAVSVEADGFKGQGCTAASEFLTQALGTVASVTKKPEHSQVSTTTSTTQHQRT
jgi:hypothetical protein